MDLWRSAPNFYSEKEPFCTVTDKNRVLSETTGLCTECLNEVPGKYEAIDGSVYLRRTCPEHGEKKRKVWGSVEHWEWASKYSPDIDENDHLVVDGDHACLAVIEVTRDCNLSCSYCFASSGPGGERLSFEEVTHLIDVVLERGGTRPIQMSGGEPTVRDDLPELVEYATERGFGHIQVNTNGIELAKKEGYAKTLKEAGLTAVYLQFDGVTSETYESIREKDILEEKHQAIEACRRVDLPVVLVPTVVPGVNDDEMGDILRFGLENTDIVESVNFQPVAHFGRYEKNDGRFSLDEAARTLAEQVEGIGTRDVLPVPCCSSYCQMATAVTQNPSSSDGDLIPLTSLVDDSVYDALSDMVDETDWMRYLTASSKQEVQTEGQTGCSSSGCCGGSGGIDVPEFAEGLLDDALRVSITGFMDADAGDSERLANCCISVPTPDGELVPFCGYNMTTEDGRYEMRNRNNWGGVDTSGVPSPSEDGTVEIETPPAEGDD
jgi:uncharacterized radical SAM superfamily Fe-S cluster-containing enzyme